MHNEKTISWLLEGDPSIQYLVRRDLLGADKPELMHEIEMRGWAKRLLSKRRENGHWGKGFYQPKWTCSHYILLDLKNLSIYPHNQLIKESLDMIFLTEKSPDGGIKPISTLKKSDVCINGMFLNYASYFGSMQKDLVSIVDFLLSEHMKDGGFNCKSNRKGAIHSSMHSTISVLEGFAEYRRSGYSYRISEINQAELDGRNFLLKHKLFRSDRTGEIISHDFLKLHYPCRWHYDILRALDYFRESGAPLHPGLAEAIDIINRSQSPDGRWKLSAPYPGKTYFSMEKAGMPSRWNTLRALRCLKKFKEII